MQSDEFDAVLHGHGIVDLVVLVTVPVLAVDFGDSLLSPGRFGELPRSFFLYYGAIPDQLSFFRLESD